MPKPRSLPPLPALLAFEAAAAHENFSAAARALGLSQAAVSQHVLMIEQSLGQPLFRRLHRGVALTEAGASLAAAIAQGLDRIEDSLAALRQEATQPTLGIATDFGFASFWLMPRLSALAEALPGVEVCIITSQRRGAGLEPEADVAVRFGAEGDGRVSLFTERVVPVCSPAFAARHGLSEGGGFDWARLPLLDLDTGEAALWMGWRDWFAHNRLPRRARGAAMLHLGTYPLVVEAAMQGQGAALGWRPLIDRALAAGQLVPMAEEQESPGRGYGLAIPERSAAKPAVEAFRRWLLRECGAG